MRTFLVMGAVRDRWGDMYDDPSRLHSSAEHYRKLARIIADHMIVAQLLETAQRLEATAKQMEDEGRSKKSS